MEGFADQVKDVMSDEDLLIVKASEGIALIGNDSGGKHVI